jgi:hypothetical protein
MRSVDSNVESRISKKRKHVPEDKLRELASDPNGSLFHETLMLNEAAARCAKPTGVRDLETYVLNTMAIECFLVHFRNLRDFLYPDADTADNRVAFQIDFSTLTTQNSTPMAGSSVTDAISASDNEDAPLCRFATLPVKR